MAHYKFKRLLALGKAYLLEPRPLIGARRNEQEPSKDFAGGCHREIEQSGTLKSPLRQCSERRESGPYKEIANSEPNSRSK